MFPLALVKTCLLPRWPSTIPYPTRIRGIIVQYTSMLTNKQKKKLNYKPACPFHGH